MSIRDGERVTFEFGCWSNGRDSTEDLCSIQAVVSVSIWREGSQGGLASIRPVNTESNGKLSQRKYVTMLLNDEYREAH